MRCATWTTRWAGRRPSPRTRRRPRRPGPRRDRPPSGRCRGRAVVDRVEHEGLGRPQVVEVRADLRRPRSAAFSVWQLRAALAEQLTPVLLRRREVGRRWRRGCRCGLVTAAITAAGIANPRSTSATTKLTSASRRVPRLCEASRAPRAAGAAAHGDEQDAQAERTHEDERRRRAVVHTERQITCSAPSARREGLDGGRDGAEVAPSRPPPPPAARAPRARRRRAVGLGRHQRLEVVDEDVDRAAGDRQLLQPAARRISSGSVRTIRRWRS